MSAKNFRYWICVLVVAALTGAGQAQEVKAPASGHSPYGTPLYRAPVPNRTVAVPPGARRGMGYYYGWGAGGYGYGMGTVRYGENYYNQSQAPGYHTTKRARDHRSYDNDPFNYNSTSPRSRSQRQR